MTQSPTSSLSTFAQDVRTGLRRQPRELSSKWFYDERGSELFRQIMACPEYYLTDAEAEIYRGCAADLLDAVGDRPFDLIELGAGDGSKTQLLIERFLAAGAQFAYRPIDLSASAIEGLEQVIRRRWPSLDFNPIQADYFEALDRLGSATGGRPRLLLFPGANIGNYTPKDAVSTLKSLRQFLKLGDLMLTGFDLRKDPAVILAAYNDAAGLTRDFNLNLLTRINRELGADFRLDCWRHWETYDPIAGAARSYLVPVEDQEVKIIALNDRFTFSAWEPIRVEISQKYSLREVEGMADASGFRHLRHFTDARAYFANSLWSVTD
jgi:dimethylhistidine N-methyltransferase